MADLLDIVKRANEAFESKDFATIRSLLHSDYRCVGPEMEAHSLDEMLKLMENCPFDCHFENAEYLVSGNKVVQTGDMVATSPVSYRNRMCDVITVEDGKIRSEELFYDTAKVPKAAAECNKQEAQDWSRAA